MKCKYCGKELAPGSKFCDGCGASINEMDQTPLNNQYQGGYQPNYQPNNNNTGLKIAIVVLSIVVVAAIIFAVWFFVIRDDDSKKNDDNDTSEKTDKENKDDDKDDKNDDDDDDTTTEHNTGSNSHKLTCTGSAMGYETEMTFYFNKKETEVTKMDMKMTMDLDNSILEYYDSKDEMVDELEKSICDENDYDSCKVTLKKNTVVVEATTTDEADLSEYQGYSIDEIKDEMEPTGFKCK